MFRALKEEVQSKAKQVKNEVVKFKDGLDIELAPLAKIQDCLEILNKAYVLSDSARFALKASTATACAGAGASFITKKNSNFGLFGKAIAFGAALFAAGVLLEREFRPLSTALPENKLNRILNVAKELDFKITKDSTLGSTIMTFNAIEKFLQERREASKSGYQRG